MTDRRYSDVMIGQRAYGEGASSGTINLGLAGTRQFAVDIPNLAGNTPYVRRNVIAVLLDAPEFFRYMADTDLLVENLKRLIEVHARTITGLNQTLHVEYAEAPASGSGEVIETVTNVTRERSTPTLTCYELAGRSITRFINLWIRYGLADPNSKVPLVVTEANLNASQWDQNFASATVLFFEPDPTWSDINAAWLCANMQPKEGVTWEGGRDTGVMGQYEEVSIPFTAVTEVSIAVDNLARQVMGSMSKKGLDPEHTDSILGSYSADVAKATNGLKDQLDDAANNRIEYTNV